MTTNLPTLTFGLPWQDPKFLRLPEQVQQVVRARLAIMQRMRDAVAAGKPVRDAARDLCAEAASGRGWRTGTVLKLWYAFLKAVGDWKVLVDRAKAGPAWWSNRDEMPREFIEFLSSELSMRQRGKFNSAYEKLMRRLKAWRQGDEAMAIPGYEAPPFNAPFKDHPEGWSSRNLRRLVKETKRGGASDYALKLIQIGSKAASEFTPKIPKTREGLEVGQFYVPDDVWNDFRVLYSGKGCRILSLHCLDLASGCNPLRGHKPALEDERGVEQRLKEREMVFLMGALFSTVGYRPAGTTVACENATATIRAQEERMLAELTNDAIKVVRGPAGGGPGIMGLFNGPAGGNPRHKAPMESWFNLMHNRMDHMLEFPGQTGSLARVNDPEGLEKMEAEDEAVWQAMQLLPPDKQQLIEFNLLSYRDAVPAIDAICEVINTRRDHNLNNWYECGHIVPAFRLHPRGPLIPAQYVTRLAPECQEKLKALLQAHPELVGEVSLSPREVFNAGAGKLRKFSPEQSALFMGGLERIEARVQCGVLVVQCKEVNPHKEIEFGPIIRDCKGSEEALQNGEKWSVLVNPFSPQSAFVYDARGGWRGLAKMRIAANSYNGPVAEANYKAAKQAQSAWLAGARRLAAPITARATRIARTNATVAGAHAQEQNDLAEAADAALLAKED